MSELARNQLTIRAWHCTTRDGDDGPAPFYSVLEPRPGVQVPACPTIAADAQAPWLEACVTPPPIATPASSAGALADSARASRLPRPSCSGMHSGKPAPTAHTPSRIPRRSLQHPRLPNSSEARSKCGGATLLQELSPSMHPGSLLAFSASDDSTDRLDRAEDTSGPYHGVAAGRASADVPDNGTESSGSLLSGPSEAVLQAISPRFEVSSVAVDQPSSPVTPVGHARTPRAHAQRPAPIASPDNLLAIMTQADSTPEELRRLAACKGLQRQRSTHAPYDLLASVLSGSVSSDDDGEDFRTLGADQGSGAGFRDGVQDQQHAAMQPGSVDGAEQRSCSGSGSGTARGGSQSSFRSEFEEACSRVLVDLQ